MVKNRKKDYVHIHIPKCAGHTVSHVLGNKGIVHHFTALYYRTFVSKKSFLISIYRNPLERMKSIFFHCQNNILHRESELCREKEINTFLNSNLIAFSKLNWKLKEFKQDEQWESDSPFFHNKLGSAFWFMPQICWLSDVKNEIIINKLYRIDNLENFFSDFSSSAFNKNESKKQKVILKEKTKDLIWEAYRNSWEQLENFAVSEKNGQKNL